MSSDARDRNYRGNDTVTVVFLASNARPQSLTAQRSVLSIENFNSAVATALTHSRARGETFIVSDPVPITIAELIADYRKALGRPPWLIPMPDRWLEFGLKAVGLGSIWERIGRPLVVRPRKLLALGWKPS